MHLWFSAGCSGHSFGDEIEEDTDLARYPIGFRLKEGCCLAIMDFLDLVNQSSTCHSSCKDRKDPVKTRYWCALDAARNKSLVRTC